MMVGLDLYLFMYWKIKNADSAAKSSYRLCTNPYTDIEKQNA